MKNSILLIGLILIVLNTLTGMIFSGYHTLNITFSNFSILLSTIIIYLSFHLGIADGFKIGYTVLFSLSGFFRFIFAVISSPQLRDNYLLIFFIVLLFFEVVLLFIAKALTNK